MSIYKHDLMIGAAMIGALARGFGFGNASVDHLNDALQEGAFNSRRSGGSVIDKGSRRGGQMAHRRWKKARTSGIHARVRH